LNNPYIYATNAQKWATKISTVSHYMKLLAFPHPLSSDYSYNQIPYKSFAHYSVWLSLILHIGLIILGWKYILKRHILGFAIFVYLVYLSMVGNIVMDIGATMGERLIYHSSLGFCVALAWFIIELGYKMKADLPLKRITVISIFAIIVSLYGFKTIERNKDWKSDITLFTKDVETVPNSVLANGNAGARSIDLADFPENKDKREEYLNKAIEYLNKALDLHPKYVNGYLNLGLANYKLKNLEQSEAAWMMAKKYFPNNPYLRQFLPLLSQEFLTRGFKKAEQKDFVGALADIEKAAQLDPNNYMTFYHLGGAYYTVGNYRKAYESWQRCLQLNPNFEEAKKGVAALQPLVN
ncbi:MAG: tetratricopeptide repeat protein, partial [Bacteroidia bacterium]